jgi:hypothetical protein
MQAELLAGIWRWLAVENLNPDLMRCTPDDGVPSEASPASFANRNSTPSISCNSLQRPCAHARQCNAAPSRAIEVVGSMFGAGGRADAGWIAVVTAARSERRARLGFLELRNIKLNARSQAGQLPRF